MDTNEEGTLSLLQQNKTNIGILSNSTIKNSNGRATKVETVDCMELVPSNKEEELCAVEVDGTHSNTKLTPSLDIPAILVQKADKKYGQKFILETFNMVVPQHQVYFLLGSSGSGKTTILSCMVGLRKLNSGNVYILGKRTGTKESGVPGRAVGYMPQELALNAECNVSEILHFFGRLYGMSPKQIKFRMKYLLRLLNLESCTQIISNLSGGQQRRASLAVALLHEPDILILGKRSEVGRFTQFVANIPIGHRPSADISIWRHLLELTEEKRCSVICTTHYIEETQQAGRIGIIRNGRMLAEGHPCSLMEKYNSDTLSKMVLKLCVQDGVTSSSEPDTQAYDLDDYHAHVLVRRNIDTMCSKKDRPKTTTSRNRLHALTIKNGLVMARNWWFIIFLAIVPAVTVSLFCSCVGSHPTDLIMGVVNYEFPGEICTGGKACNSGRLSCRFLKEFDGDMIRLIPFESEHEALEEVRLTNIWGYMTFHENYSHYMYQRAHEDPLGDTWNETYYGSLVKINMDMSSPSIGLVIKKLIFDAYRKFTVKLLTACQIDPTGRDIPLSFVKPVFGDNDDPVAHFIAPGVALGFVFFLEGLTCGLFYIVEKKDGMLSRTIVAGVSKLEIMLSHFILQFFVMLTQVIILFYILFSVFDIPCHGSMPLAFLLVVINSVSGMCLGFLVACICSEEKNAMLLAIATILPSLLLSGLIWPINSLPKFLQRFSFVIPATMAGESIRSIVLRGLPFTHHIVWSGFIASSAWTLFYICLTVILNWIVSKRN